jgi:lipopolysaccharide biosynthesis protein
MQTDFDKTVIRFAANGRMQPEDAIQIATTALTEAQAEQVSTLMLDLQEISLTRALSITECHEVGERLARAGQALCKVAVVARAACVEAHEFIFTVARNRGLQVVAFTDQSEAVGWLVA